MHLDGAKVKADIEKYSEGLWLRLAGHIKKEEEYIFSSC